MLKTHFTQKPASNMLKYIFIIIQAYEQWGYHSASDWINGKKIKYLALKTFQLSAHEGTEKI